MSVRTEPRDLSQQLQQTLTITPEMMAAQSPVATHATAMMPAVGAGAIEPHMNEQHLHEANSFNTNNEQHPLERTVCVNIRASLSDLCLKSQSATWAPPSAEATKAIFQQARPEPATRTAPTASRQAAAARAQAAVCVGCAASARPRAVATVATVATLATVAARQPANPPTRQPANPPTRTLR